MNMNQTAAQDMQDTGMGMDFKRAMMLDLPTLHAVLAGQSNAVNIMAAMTAMPLKLKQQQAMQAPAQPAGPQPTVREQMAQETAPMGGIGELPAASMEGMAGGGIVSFAEGGATGEWTDPAEDPGSWENYRRGIGNAFGAMASAPVEGFKWLVNAPGTKKEKPATKPGVDGRGAQDMTAYVPRGQGASSAPAAASAPASPTGGIASVRASSKSSNSGSAAAAPGIDSLMKAPSEDDFMKSLGRFKDEMSKDEKGAFDEEKGVIEKDRESSKKRRQDAKSDAIIQAGLAMAAGKSGNFLTNVAEGALKGVDFYNAAQRAEDLADKENSKAQLALARYKTEMSKGNTRDAVTAMTQYRTFQQNAEQLKIQAGTLAESTRHNKAAEGILSAKAAGAGGTDKNTIKYAQLTETMRKQIDASLAKDMNFMIADDATKERMRDQALQTHLAANPALAKYVTGGAGAPTMTPSAGRLSSTPPPGAMIRQ